MMASKKLVVALGGNALQSQEGNPTAEEQLHVAKKTGEHLAEILAFGYDMTIVHGNGPQVGRLVLACEAAKNITPPMPLDVCSSMTQGYIGYHLQQGLNQALKDRGNPMPVVSVITQIIVDPQDPAMKKPEKPIGPFYTQEEAKKMMDAHMVMKEDAGRGWRRTVASPFPRKIVEMNSIRELSEKAVVITCGGGGIPVIEDDQGTLKGVDAVIDKDHAAGLLGQELDSDILLILTAVDYVATDFNTEKEEKITQMNVAQAEKYIKENHFAPGSMLPKVKAAMDFVQGSKEKKAIITSLDKGVEALKGEIGTVITWQ